MKTITLNLLCITALQVRAAWPSQVDRCDMMTWVTTHQDNAFIPRVHMTKRAYKLITVIMHAFQKEAWFTTDNWRLGHFGQPNVSHNLATKVSFLSMFGWAAPNTFSTVDWIHVIRRRMKCHHHFNNIEYDWLEDNDDIILCITAILDYTMGKGNRV